MTHNLKRISKKAQPHDKVMKVIVPKGYEVVGVRVPVKPDFFEQNPLNGVAVCGLIIMK